MCSARFEPNFTTQQSKTSANHCPRLRRTGTRPQGGPQPQRPNLRARPATPLAANRCGAARRHRGAAAGLRYSESGAGLAVGGARRCSRPGVGSPASGRGRARRPPRLLLTHLSCRVSSGRFGSGRNPYSSGRSRQRRKGETAFWAAGAGGQPPPAAARGGRRGQRLLRELTRLPLP